jgi:hypothetical protein
MGHPFTLILSPKGERKYFLKSQGILIVMRSWINPAAYGGVLFQNDDR